MLFPAAYQRPQMLCNLCELRSIGRISFRLAGIDDLRLSGQNRSLGQSECAQYSGQLVGGGVCGPALING